jgi:hypothetical protein
MQVGPWTFSGPNPTDTYPPPNVINKLVTSIALCKRLQVLTTIIPLAYIPLFPPVSVQSIPNEPDDIIPGKLHYIRVLCCALRVVTPTDHYETNPEVIDFN